MLFPWILAKPNEEYKTSQPWRQKHRHHGLQIPCHGSQQPWRIQPRRRHPRAPNAPCYQSARAVPNCHRLWGYPTTLLKTCVKNANFGLCSAPSCSSIMVSVRAMKLGSNAHNEHIYGCARETFQWRCNCIATDDATHFFFTLQKLQGKICISYQ